MLSIINKNLLLAPNWIKYSYVEHDSQSYSKVSLRLLCEFIPNAYLGQIFTKLAKKIKKIKIFSKSQKQFFKTVKLG